ncbi:MAG TPA: class I tRNA ligase family protein, partial [Micromonosporaceae bacterium]|nr:class I tRNA ligase family protein [Micromonosporaceae bacterium]
PSRGPFRVCVRPLGVHSSPTRSSTVEAEMYLTTPIYYVNDVPHLGHAYTTVLADALVRAERLYGRPARLVTGTDEHGLKVQRAAESAGVAPATFAASTAARFRSAWDRLGIGYDDFVRTTSGRHRAVVEELLQSVYDRGFVELGRYRGRYCVGCEAYVAEPVCPIHRRATDEVSEENYFFRLSALESPLRAWLAGHPDVIRPAVRRNEALGLLRDGLADFSISRTSIDWGVPLPWDPKHVAYVWFDALGAYLTGADGQWPAHHLIGKDILRFHAIYWPAILLAAGLAPPARITVHGFLLVRGSGGLVRGSGGREKISKSGLPGIPLDDLLDEFGVDAVRYHLLRSYPVGPDGDFSVDGLRRRYRADLANTLGNLVSRLSALVVSRCGGVGPAPDPDSALAAVAAKVLADVEAAWTDVQPADALAAVWRLVAAANAYLVAAEPWRLAEGPALDRVLGDVLEAVRIVALLAYPAIPGAAAVIWRRIGLSGPVSTARLPDDAQWGRYAGGRPVVKAAPLFPRL